MKKNIGVIGAGIGGLSTAARLAAQGHKVKLWERTESAGGKMNQIIKNGYRFDTGPSLLTMLFVIEKLFKDCGRNVNDYLSFEPINPLCRYNWTDGTVFDCSANLQQTLGQIAAFAPEDCEEYVKFLGYAADLYQKTADTFIMNPLQTIKDLKNLKKSDVFKIDAFPTVSTRVDRCFKSEYLRQVFKRFATYNGSSPYLAPATINVIAYVELCLGAYYVKGGLYKIAEALERLCLELGVEITYNADITRITTKEKTVSGLELADGSTHKADAVFSNSDATFTYAKLLDADVIKSKKRSRFTDIEPSCSGFVMLLGVRKTFPQLKHHNIFFGRDYEKEFAEIFQRKVLPEDPTIYIANTSYSDAGHAPEGCSNLFILINAPYLTDKVVWTEELSRDYGDLIIKKLEKFGLENLQEFIEVREHISPQEFYDRYRSNRGSIYGTSSNHQFSAFMRPRNKSPYLDGLYLVGGSTHPGGGIPLAMLSADHAVTIFNRNQKP
ncbi:MAG: phytoene desaturase [Candidatus Cyclonatronum sp.]|uniref:phytoene desaturase family protein n=1 Tax=Cyclonatronum sp. TaxID=3024185 RepID=UPI0025C371CD|nr:phytoene desaturase family protein [Cyclonatronum sp.]MCC5933197.1 phytoene desaturase [Balneolales bacterium]MCH8485903.1 phytoene desaturase [Cyclonatronum sp.]